MCYNDGLDIILAGIALAVVANSASYVVALVVV